MYAGWLTEVLVVLSLIEKLHVSKRIYMKNITIDSEDSASIFGISAPDLPYKSIVRISQMSFMKKLSLKPVHIFRYGHLQPYSLTLPLDSKALGLSLWPFSPCA